MNIVGSGNQYYILARIRLQLDKDYSTQNDIELLNSIEKIDSIHYYDIDERCPEKVIVNYTTLNGKKKSINAEFLAAMM